MRPAVLRCCGWQMSALLACVPRMSAASAGASEGIERYGCASRSSWATRASLARCASSSCSADSVWAAFCLFTRSSHSANSRFSSSVVGSSGLMGTALPVSRSRATKVKAAPMATRSACSSLIWIRIDERPTQLTTPLRCTSLSRVMHASCLIWSTLAVTSSGGRVLGLSSCACLNAVFPASASMSSRRSPVRAAPYGLR
mmetsp:Transcript_51376/g.109795  ORF Transcript_51376/g.109795 Transcript_51376/m.109795 type:complete len:200 (-) Transcript_51376:341-940(-)